MAAGHRDPGDAVEPEGLLRRRQGRDLAADAEPVAGILHVRADRDLAVHRFDRAADAEPGIRRIGAQRGPARAFDEGIAAAHRNGGSSKLRSLREWSWTPSRLRIRSASMPILRCWLIARS